MASAEDRANKQLPKAFIETYQIFKAATGIPRETKFMLDSSMKGAKTDSKTVSFGPEWVDSAIPENFHGFGADVATVQSMNQFVIAHEIGHLSVQPGWKTNWMVEIRSWPINLSRQGFWSNVYSDVLVNTHIFKARDWTRKPRNEEEEQILALMEWSQRWHLGSRICKNTNGHGQLRASGAVVDNRFQPEGEVIGTYQPHLPGDTFKPVPGKTPLYQIRQGHGRGYQVYPPIPYSLATGLPNNYLRVRVPKYHDLFQCTVTGEIMPGIVLNNGKSPKGHSVTSAGSIAPGTYEVTEAYDIEGKRNSKLPTFLLYYVINGVKVPFYLTEELCPDCGEPASCDVTDGWGGSACSERATLWRILMIQQYAGFRALSSGHKGKTGFAAGHQFLEDVAIATHYAELTCMEQNP